MYHLRPEESLLLSLSRFSPAYEPITEKTDFDALTRLASRHETAPLVYKALEPISNIPDKTRARLKNAYRASAGVNTRNATEALRILSLLKDRGVPSIPLKGPFASRAILGDGALYPSSDIDLLVHPEDLKTASSALMDDGYQPFGQSETDMLKTHYHLVFMRPPFYVELHWNLTKRYYRVPPESWWENLTQNEFEGTPIPALSPERYFLALSFRAMSHEFSKLKFLVLPAELINRGDIDFERLHSLSADYGMQRLTAFMLKLLHELLGTQVPNDYLEYPIPWYSTLRSAVLEDLFIEKRSSYRRALYLLLLDSSSERVRALVRRILPSPSEIRLRYNIREDSPKVWLYYVLNPVLLPAMLLRRRRP